MFLKRDLNSWLAKNMPVSFILFSVSDIKDHNFLGQITLTLQLDLCWLKRTLFMVLDRYFLFLYEVDIFKIFRLP